MRKPSATFVLSLAATLLMIGVGMIVALLPQRVYALSGSLENVSMIAAFFAVAYLATQLPVGMLADRIGAKPLLVTGYMLCGLAGVFFYNADTALAVFFGRAIQGIGEAPVWALGPAMLAAVYPLRKGRAIGIYNASFHGGLMLGPLTGLLISPTGQSQIPFLAFAGLSFAGGMCVLVLLPGKAARVESAAPARPPLGRFWVLLAQPGPLVVLAGIVLYGACYGAFVSVLPISLVVLKGFDGWATSILFVLFYAAISVSQLVAGPLCDRFGRTGFMAGGMALAAAGFAAFPALPGLWVYAPLFAASLGLGAFCVASLAALNDRVPVDLKGTTSGAYYLAWSLGYVLGPLGIGRTAWIDPEFGYYVLAAAMAAMSVLLSRPQRE